jgi:hypothetical protein
MSDRFFIAVVSGLSLLGGGLFVSTFLGNIYAATPASELRVSIPLNNAQIRALPSTAVPLVSLAGAGKQIHFVKASLKLQASASYTNVNAADASIWIERTDGTTQISNYIANYTTPPDNLVELTEFLSSGGHSAFLVMQHPVASFHVAETWGTNPNTGLQLKGFNNGAGDWTGGGTNDLLIVDLYYTIERIP